MITYYIKNSANSKQVKLLMFLILCVSIVYFIEKQPANNQNTNKVTLGIYFPGKGVAKSI
jgi:hypothetical protein